MHGGLPQPQPVTPTMPSQKWLARKAKSIRRGLRSNGGAGFEDQGVQISEENAASWLRGMIKAGATAQEISELLDHAKALGYDRDGLHVAGKSLLEKKRWDAMPAMQPSRRETPAHAAIAAAASSVTLKPGMDNFNLLKRLGAAIKGEVT
jgi:hypothetical protein